MVLLCTYLTVNGALEVSSEGGESVVLGGKAHIHLAGLAGEGPVTAARGRVPEDTNGDSQLGVHGGELAHDTAGQLGEQQG